MDKNKCPIFIFSKNFYEIFVVFLNETEHRDCRYYFCNGFIYSNKIMTKIIFMF